MIEVGSDFSGVGAFEQALKKLGIDYRTVFACDMDKYARQTYIENYGEPDYYPENVYDRKIPKNPLGVYMTSPPCQGFSLAGKRKGSILFLNSHEFIKINKPKIFIFENVKGLLSHDKTNKKEPFGKTFNKWIEYLGGKSVNGLPVIFPHQESVPYHIYHKVLNAKDYGVPQNRERVFIVGIRDDHDNDFNWPKPFHLKKRLKDLLETNVDEKYFLSEKLLRQISKWNSNQNPLDNIFDGDDVMSCVLARGDGETHAGMKLIKVKSATKSGYEEATPNDSINFSVPNSETRRGRVGKGVAQTLDTACNQGVMILGGRMVGRNPENPKSRKAGEKRAQTIEVNENPEITNCISTVQKDNVLIEGYRIRRLTPRECFRLMDFSDSFKMPCSDSQMYKQAGNSIVVNVLAKIIEKLSL